MYTDEIANTLNGRCQCSLYTSCI